MGLHHGRLCLGLQVINDISKLNKSREITRMDTLAGVSSVLGESSLPNKDQWSAAREELKKVYGGLPSFYMACTVNDQYTQWCQQPVLGEQMRDYLTAYSDFAKESASLAQS